MTVARALIVAALAGCQPLAPIVDNSNQEALAALDVRVADLSNQVTSLERTAVAATSSHEVVATELSEHSLALLRVESALAGLPDMIKAACPPVVREDHSECAKPTPIRVPVTGDKLVVGVREHVLIDPLELGLVARIDAGTAGNTLYVQELVEFQRDGDNWVRFSLKPPTAQAPVEIERQITRRKNATEDAKGKEIGIRLRMTLADVTETYEFALLARKTSDYQVRLGRSFLKDMALVDVSKRFLQPAPRPDDH